MGALPANSARDHPVVLNSVAKHLLQKTRLDAASMVEHQLDPRHPKADNVVLKLKRSTAMKPDKRDPIGLRLCVGLGR